MLDLLRLSAGLHPKLWRVDGSYLFKAKAYCYKRSLRARWAAFCADVRRSSRPTLSVPQRLSPQVKLVDFF
jgi:hypothetical protein